MSEPPFARSRRKRVRHWLTLETTSGGLLVAAALIALVWANSPWRTGYFDLSKIVVGPPALHLDLSLASWATDGLLAIFFFVVGVELKHEFVAGSLRNMKEAAVPIFAAIGGMVLPAALYIGIVLVAGDPGALRGWAIPTATDIAFALAILAIFGRGLPTALRTFLLALAVVDDLLAIVIIAVFYTAGINILAFVLALAAIALFALAVRMRTPRWWILLPLAVVAWALMHDSGVHATIAGVLLGVVVPAKLLHDEPRPRTHHYEHAVRLWSAAVALPIFAFFAAGVSIVDAGGAGALFAQPVVTAIVVGLVVGKLVGVLATTALVTRFSALRLPESLNLRDLVPVGLLTGIGFTVSLLIAELSFPGAVQSDGAKIAILTATLIATVLAAATLRWDSHKAR
ncbi:MAG: Na+/H+ antiporter NhaA [Micrococcales bacterium]|nr:Na+/H+ antiporter NhaA [Micrococcales bacterium]